MTRQANRGADILNPTLVASMSMSELSALILRSSPRDRRIIKRHMTKERQKEFAAWRREHPRERYSDKAFMGSFLLVVVFLGVGGLAVFLYFGLQHADLFKTH